MSPLPFLALLASLLASASCASTGVLSGPWPQVSTWPEASWPTSTPEAQGMDPGTLARAIDAVVDEDLPVHGLLVVRHGHVVLDVAFDPFSRDDRHDVASVTKSVTATLVGIALAQGKLAGLDQPVIDLFPERAVIETDPRKRAMTLGDLLTMRTGLDCEVVPGGDQPLVLKMMQSNDWAGYALGRPMADAPGTRFRYCSLGSHLLGVTLRKATGVSALKYAETHLFGPLGITSADWPVDPATGDPHGWGDLALTRYDMARLGYLYLSEGRWRDRQVLPREWVRAALQRQVRIPPFGPIDGYGYQWWTSTQGLAVAMGRGDQWLIVAPRAGMVIVMTGAGVGPATGRKAELIQQFILGAIRGQGAIAADGLGSERLKSAVARAESPRTVGPAAGGQVGASVGASVGTSMGAPLKTPEMPAVASTVLGAPYDLAQNDYGLEGVTVGVTSATEATVDLQHRGASPLGIVVGLDGAWRTFNGRRGYPARARGRWESANTLVVEVDELALINRWTLSLTFDGDRLTTRLDDASGNPPAVILGSRRGAASRSQ